MFCEDLSVAPDLFTDTSVLAGTPKEQMEVMAGKDIIELGEMAGLHQTTRSRIKAFITRKRDRARMAYDRFAIDMERRGVCIGTSNPSKYLSDSTGERRWWPIAMTKYERDEFLRDKDQLYAEALAREPTENLWLDTDELQSAHAELVATRKEPNELVDLLSELHGEQFEAKGSLAKEERVSTEAIRTFIGMKDGDVLRIKGLGATIADAMAHLGWTKSDRTLVCSKNGKPTRGYFRPYMQSPPIQPDDSAPTAREKAPAAEERDDEFPF
jgi:predicted P-loop ATPase